MKTVIALTNQNLFDICLQEYGTIETVFDFMIANNIEGLNSGLLPGKRYKLPATAKVDKFIQTQYLKEGIKVVTGTVGNYRITEDEITRISEDGTIRIIE